MGPPSETLPGSFDAAWSFEESALVTLFLRMSKGESDVAGLTTGDRFMLPC